MVVNSNETIFWVVMEDGGVVSGSSYFKYYCSTPYFESFLVGEQDNQEGQVKEEDFIKDILYST